MTNGIEEVDREMLSTIKRHAGLGMALGIGIAIAGVLAIMSPFVAGLSVAIVVGVLFSNTLEGNSLRVMRGM